VWSAVTPRILESLASEERDICHYGFTEMVNNAIEHSMGRHLSVAAHRTSISIEIMITDNGVGVFEKVASALRLAEPREALLELSKGKLTTDPRRHTGEGIFFTSRVFDRFRLCSGLLCLTHSVEREDWSAAETAAPLRGTRAEMALLVPSHRTLQQVFSSFSSGPDEYRFAKTHVPLKLAQLGEENLVSRSQARRVLARVQEFDEVILDFAGVRSIGQGFADEIFRVFAAEHPSVRLTPVHANEQVTFMIRRALSGRHRPA